MWTAGTVALLVVPELRVKARFMFQAQVQANTDLSDKEVIHSLFILTHAHPSLRRALRYFTNPQTQSKEK